MKLDCFPWLPFKKLLFYILVNLFVLLNYKISPLNKPSRVLLLYFIIIAGIVIRLTSGVILILLEEVLVR
jgi:hypothetical protein